MTAGSWWRRLDRVQPIAALALAVLGVMTIFSANADWRRQVVWIALGIAAYAVAASFDYRRLVGLAPALYIVMLLLLIAVHVVGRSALGARRWLSLGGFPLEPSELSKLMLVLVLAAFLSRRESLSWRRFAIILLLVAPPAALIVTQPDLGTTIVFIAVFVGLLFVGGARPLHLASLGAVAVCALPLFPLVLHGYQLRRLRIFLNPSRDPLGAGYNLLQARIAVGAGSFFGQGWLHGLQGQLGFVPERATDFVFAIFAEQFGLLGSLVLLAVFGTLLVRVLKTAAVAPDRFGELVAAGVFVMIFVQVVENVGMNIGALPIAGIPLPLISYGGSATITTLAALGLVQSVALRRRTVAYEPPGVVLASSRASRARVSL